MPPHSQLSLGPMEGKPVAQPRGTASSVDAHAVTPPRVKDLLALITESVDGTCSEKEAAISLGLPSPQYWSAVKSGDRPAPRCNRVTDLPELTQREVCSRWARQLGMEIIERDAKLRVIAELAEVAVRALKEIA